MSRKIKYTDLERENEKLAQDIDEIQHVLAVHKNGMSKFEDAKKSQSKTSIWGAGAEGPLLGFNSRKAESSKSKFKKSENSKEETIRQHHNREWRDKSKLKDSKTQSGLTNFKPHGSNTARTSEKRREWKRMQPRRVSFNIDDDDYDDVSKKGSKDGLIIENTEPVNPTNVAKSQSEPVTTEEKISALKVKVLAKANSKVKSEMRKKKNIETVNKDSRSTLNLQSTKIGVTEKTGRIIVDSSNLSSTNKLKESYLDGHNASTEHDLQCWTANKNDLAVEKLKKEEDSGLVDDIELNDLIGQPLTTDSIRIPDPEILAWLKKFDLDEESSTKMIKFITSNSIVADKLNDMTERDWLDVGLSDPIILNHLLSRGSNSPQTNNGPNDNILFTKTNQSENSGKGDSRSIKVRPQSAKDLSKQQMAKNKPVRPSSAKVTSNSRKITKEKNISKVKDAATILNKAGVSKASQKLKEKQQQEELKKKKKEKEVLQRKTQRDKMAAHHQKRLEEKEKTERQEEKDDVDGSSCSPGRPQSVNDLSLVAQGIILPDNFKNEDLNSAVTSSEPSIVSVADSVSSAKQIAEDQLRKIELQVIGLQENIKVSDGSVEESIQRLQKQLSDIQKELSTQTAKETSRSEVKGSPEKGAKKKSGDTLHSRTELMREVRKQKEQHRKEIRMLESELSRLKHRDPIKHCELSQEDINYSDEDIIGEGTFSQVFHGKFNGSEVAIKRLKQSLRSTDKNYFAEEVSLLHGLRHPRIVLLIGVCTTGKLPLMVLEYMSSGSLHQYLQNRNMPKLDHVSYYRISKDIALGMTYLHRHKPPVLHLDLKSLNILLNSYGRAKIADFGFSKLKHDAEELSGGLRGTPAWMAPEMLDPTLGTLSIKADVYSFGVILWEMLTRETPYKGVAVYQILECIRNNKRPEIPDYCPDPLKNLITRCWMQKASHRPAFKEILISLEGLQLPLEWRSLLNTAGIPHEIMDEPNSARSIINLINQSVDISVQELNELSLKSHDEFMKDALPLAEQSEALTDQTISTKQTDKTPVPPPIVNLAKFIEEQTKITKLRSVHLPGGVSKCAIISAVSDKPPTIPSEDLINQKLKLKSTVDGPHPSQLANLNNITQQKFTSIAEVLRQSVNYRRFAMQMRSDSVEPSTIDSNWSASSST